jgi:hypothetical protein
MFSIPDKSTDTFPNLGPLYHDFSFFGVTNEQLSDHFIQNQKAKAPVITAYIAYAKAKCETTKDSPNPSFTELFCADGYYTMIASRLGCSPCFGIDNNSEGYLDKAKAIVKRIGLQDCRFIQSEISENSAFDTTDIVANLGGLYHVSNPREILQNSFIQARQFLIVQSVVSLVTDDVTYFESPAPGWTWGSRFSRSFFHKMITDICPNVVDHHFNVLTGNQRMEDRGSVYYLLRK